MSEQSRLSSAIPRRVARVVLAGTLALAAVLGGAPRPQPAEAGGPDLVVDRTGDESGLPCTPGGNNCTLRSAVNIANTNGLTDTITFDTNFIYYTITLSSTLNLTATGTTIYAAPNQQVKINANGLGQVFYITGSDITLDGLRMYGSGSGLTNIWIANPAQRVRITRSVIGDDDAAFGGCGNSPNSYSGIYITSAANPTGSDAVAWIYGNTIECNLGSPGHGIEIHGSREVVIGENSAGQAGSQQFNFIENNAGDAVHLTPGSDLNIIRNSALQYSLGSGLVLDNSDSNRAFGNYIQANHVDGVRLTGGSRLNSIGCPLLAGDPNDASLRNVIRSNTGMGVRITGDGTDSNLILCNWIGLNDAGTGPAANGGSGVQIDSAAASNLIGVGPTTYNVISGNTLSGVVITGADTHGNLVQGNYIGTNVAATAAVGNGLDGVGLTSGATGNTIGGSSGTALNIIGGNAANGVYLSGSSTATNTVAYNDIGVNTAPIDDIALPNGGAGIRLQVGTHGNIIGGAVAANYVAYNGTDGLALASGAVLNQVLGNRAYSNGGAGLLLTDAGTQLNVINGLTAFANGQDGLTERYGAGLNTWTRVSLYNNGGLGIDKAASPGTDIPTAPYPVITSVNVGTGLIQGTASNNATVELYQGGGDRSGYGEGRSYVGTAIANGSGAWSFSAAGGQANCYSAFQTSAGASSEFGPSTCPRLFVPLIMR